MKMFRIFADQLFAFHYDGETYNEYDRLMELWTDINYLKKYAHDNGVEDVREFVNEVLNDAEQIQDFLEDIGKNEKTFGIYFEPLQDSEKNIMLSLQKGKIKRNRLRYYAVKLDDNCFIITGGAIKMSQRMQEHPDTNNELIKLNNARQYLRDNDVFDEDSFYELYIELNSYDK